MSEGHVVVHCADASDNTHCLFKNCGSCVLPRTGSGYLANASEGMEPLA